VKVVTDFGEPLFKPVKVVDRCPTQTVVPNPAVPLEPYEFDAVKGGYNRLRSKTRPEDDVINSDPDDCPITFYIVQTWTNVERLWGGLDHFLTIDSDGFVELNEENYEGGAMEAQLVALTGFREPLLKPIKITEKIEPVPICLS